MVVDSLNICFGPLEGIIQCTLFERVIINIPSNRCGKKSQKGDNAEFDDNLPVVIC